MDEVARSHKGPWVVYQDSFLSGWGMAPGRSLVAIAVMTDNEAYTVMENARGRGDAKRVRYQQYLPKLRDGDHLAIVGRDTWPRFFEPNAFVK